MRAEDAAVKVVILAGGLGTRISEESHLKPKPMIEIGGMPILVHIMKGYAAQGFNEFVICAGYKQHIIKEYFAHYYLYSSDVEFDLGNNSKTILKPLKDDWKVIVADTGLHTQTGGRVKRIGDYIDGDEFMLTYGDGVADVDLEKLMRCHRKSGKLATVSCYNFGQSKGVMDISKDGTVNAFREKSDMDGDLINIGFMVLDRSVLDLIGGDDDPLEEVPFQKLVKEKQMNAYVHTGFWQCMDTMREKEKLERLWDEGKAPWKVWS